MLGSSGIFSLLSAQRQIQAWTLSTLVMVTSLLVGFKIGQWRNGVIIILWLLYWGYTLVILIVMQHFLEDVLVIKYENKSSDEGLSRENSFHKLPPETIEKRKSRFMMPDVLEKLLTLHRATQVVFCVCHFASTCFHLLRNLLRNDLEVKIIYLCFRCANFLCIVNL